MTLHSLPVFLRLAGRPVMLIGEGESADAKRRLLERAGATVVGEHDEAALAIIALDAPEETVARLKARGVLVNAVDRSDLCDFTLPAIVDRSPVIVAIGTGGASAGLAAALRQRLETILPASLGDLAQALQAARARLRERFPKADERRRALGRALSEGGAVDPLHASAAQVEDWLTTPVFPERAEGHAVRLALSSPDPDDLTLRQARLLAQADRVVHTSDVPTAILDRARADAPRIVSVAPPVDPAEGLTVFVEIAR
ncbi:NAD(P)-dependent oxidoreductase [Sphingomonas sp.]|uniref:NAD(P)-dependent oxidoreductase n=1 Tax=Sphingomonas sp. TaxID=28214 RepID=UPI0025E6B579|nr:NAD(P)-dependent oxidoreductase [Sphingomonas sp.]